MNVGSDTFPRDEVTGLAAFEHLDPVSTVSTLSALPEVPAAPPKIFTPPPPPPMRSSVTLPPPAARVSRTFSRPPEVPMGARTSLPPPPAVPAEALRTDTTEVIDIADMRPAATGNFESWEDADEAATRVVTMADGSLAPSTTLDMDWDDEEPPTQMRGEGGVSQPKPVADVDWSDDENPQTYAREDGAATGYTPASGSGRPSPFPSVRPSAPALQTPNARSGAPSPFATATETGWSEELRSDSKPLWLIGAGAVAIVALAFVARAMLASPTPGLVTLATSPSDARVVVDGKPVSGTSSPYSAADLKPGVAHELVVQKPGFAEFRTVFTVQDGEAKQLTAVKLQPEGGSLAAAAPEPSPVAAQPTAVASVDAPKPAVAAADEAPRERSSARKHRRARHRAVASAPRLARAAKVRAPKRPVAQRVAAAGGMGVLRINSRPWSQVFVDGRMVGNTPQMGIQLPPGKHTLKLVNPAMGLEKTLSVTVKNGQTVTKVLNLIE